MSIFQDISNYVVKFNNIFKYLPCVLLCVSPVDSGFCCGCGGRSSEYSCGVFRGSESSCGGSVVVCRVSEYSGSGGNTWSTTESETNT